MILTRIHYLNFNLSNEQLDLITEGLQILRLYQQGFIDVDGAAKLTAIKHLETRINRRRERYNQKEKERELSPSPKNLQQSTTDDR